MISLFTSSQNIGGITGKIVGCRNNEIYHAGGIISSQSKTFLYGQGENPEQPEISYTRSVDVAFDGCYGMRKDALDDFISHQFHFDTYLHYFQLIQKLGYSIKYQPEAVAYINSQYSPSTGFNSIPTSSLSIRDELVLRNVDHPIQLLVIDDFIPAIRYGSGFPRLYEMLISFAELGYAVTFFPVGNTVKTQPETEKLQQKGIEVFYDPFANFAEFNKERQNCYDVICISRPHVFSKYISEIKANFPDAGIIYDAEALYYRRDQLKNNIEKIKDAQHIEKNKTEEMDLIEMADVVLAVSQEEKKLMLRDSRQENVEVWGHVQEISDPGMSFIDRKDILLIGSFFAGPGSPNEDAALYFAKSVFPLIQRNLACNLFIVGSYPTEDVKRLDSQDIKVTGYVEDLSLYFNSCKVNVVPTRFAAGIPLKLLGSYELWNSNCDIVYYR